MTPNREIVNASGDTHIKPSSLAIRFRIIQTFSCVSISILSLEGDSMSSQRVFHVFLG